MTTKVLHRQHLESADIHGNVQDLHDILSLEKDEGIELHYQRYSIVGDQESHQHRIIGTFTIDELKIFRDKITSYIRKVQS